MALFLESESLTRPAPASPRPGAPAWDEAFLRVESYLRAHHIESRVLLNRLTADIIARAQAMAPAASADETVPLAMQVTHARIGQWFARVLPEGDWTDERFRARGRLALLLADLPARWSEYFLSDEPPPGDLAEAMRTCVLQAGPELLYTHMPPTPIDSLFGDEVDPDRPPISQRPIVRAACAALLLVGIVGATWAALT